MKKLVLPLALLAVWCSPNAARADAADPKDEITPTVAPAQETSVPVSQEFSIEGGYTGKEDVKQGDAKIGNVGSSNAHFDYVVSPQIKDGVLLRLGIDGERNSFDLPAAAPLPNTLQSANLILGTDLAFGDKTIVRFEAHPGVYSDFVHLTANSFDCPVQIGGTYLWSKDFQLIFGIQIDLKSNYPVIGLPGFRWQFADNWVLSMIPPKPQIQYEFSNALTFYVGSEIIAGTYQLNDEFGSSHGHGTNTTNAQFNNNVCDYTEVRVGAGFTWKFTPNLTLDLSGGTVPYREFDYHPATIGYDEHDTSFKSSFGESWAPYTSASISGSF